MTTDRRPSTLALACVATLTGATLLAGCSGDSSGESDSSAATAASSGAFAAGGSAKQSADAPAAAPAASASSAAPQTAAGTVGTRPRVQAVIVTVGRTVRVADVPAAVRRASALATRLGGRLDGEDGQEAPGTRGVARERVVLRVPPARVDTLVAGVEAGGDVLSRTRTNQDVTQQAQDVEVRLANARASVARVREFYSRATSVRDVVLMESELSRRVADLESFETQAATLSDSTSLATVTVDFVGRERVVAAAGSDRGFTSGLGAGVDALGATTVVLLTVLGAVLPFAPLVLLVAGALWWGARVSRRRTRTA